MTALRTSTVRPGGIREGAERVLGQERSTTKFTDQLDVDVGALETEYPVTCLVALRAPVSEKIADRPGETLIAVVGI